MADTPELLVPFDGSATAECVLRRACRAVRAEGVRLLVLCVAAPPAPAPVEEASVELEASALETLARAQQVCREEAVVAIFELGYARTWADAIVEQAQRGSATLICLSLEPRGPRDAALMNPTVREVLRRAPCSVLLNDATTDLVQIPGNGRDR